MQTPPDVAYRVVRDTDPDVLDAHELDVYQRRIAELRAWCDARLVRATRRQRALATQGRAADPRSSLSNHGRQSSKDARASSEREAVCTALPGFEDALAGGEVAAGHIDAIAQATRNLDDEDRSEFNAQADSLLDDATHQSVDTFGKNCRELARSIRARRNARADVDELERQKAQSKVTRWVDQQTGMRKTLIEADPETDRRIWSAVQRERGRLRRRQQRTGGPKPSFDRLTVDAFAAAVAAPTGSGRATGDRIVVHIGLEALTSGTRGDSISETDSGVPLPVETIRRMACDAGIIPVVLDGGGVVLDEGRSKRLATAEQRIAIEAMQSTCSHPDCTVSVDECRIHHVDVWQLGGRTDLDRMAPLCETHHHLVHEGGWTLQITPDRAATWSRPDGTVHWSGTLLDRSSAPAA